MSEVFPEPDECVCPPEVPPAPHQVGCFFDGVPVSPPSAPADGPSPLFSTVAALRELSLREEPHDSPLHQTHRLSHDMPDGCRLSEEQMQGLGNPFLGGGA